MSARSLDLSVLGCISRVIYYNKKKSPSSAVRLHNAASQGVVTISGTGCSSSPKEEKVFFFDCHDWAHARCFGLLGQPWMPKSERTADHSLELVLSSCMRP